MNKLSLALITALGLSGCAIHGDSEFTCPGAEQGVCMNAGDAYEAAENGKSAKDYIRDEDGNLVSEHTHKTNKNLGDAAPIAGVMSAPISQPKPVLAAPEVVKIWVNAWEDANLVLHMAQTAFVEITPRRWSIENSDVHKVKSASPFKRVTNVTNP